MLMLEIMEIYGWDWYTYLSQPAWVLTLACDKIKVTRQLAAAQAHNTND